MRVVLAGGGSAGHVEPALATADALRRDDPAVEITLLGTDRGLETRLVPERGYELALIPPVPMPRRPTPELLRLPGRVRGAVRQTAELLRSLKAEVVVGFGGYVALPAYLAARRIGVPIVVHEANVKVGLANRVGARFTSFVAVARATPSLPRAEEVGLPLRRSITTLDRAALQAEARDFFGLERDRPTLLAFGGSQGARTINVALEGAVGSITTAGAQVLHAVGAGHADTAQPRAGYIPMPYLDRMDLAYAAADLALCRSGANTCAELAAVGLPAVYVPLPFGNGEQRINAEPTVTAGGGLLVDDAALSSAWVAENVPALLVDADRLASMGGAAATLGRRDADDRLVAMIRRAAESNAEVRR